MPRRALTLACVGLAVWASGCSIGRKAGTTIAPHVVFIAPEGCGVAIAKVHRGEYALIETVAVDGLGYTAREGDVLEGPVREGQSVFRQYPGALRNSEWTEGLEVPLNVLVTGISLSDARARLDAQCLVEGNELPRLPGAPVDE